MKQLEYVFEMDGVVHVLQTKPSANSKLGLGYIVTTYHFSINQVLDNDLKQDAGTCFDCPFSYNQNNGKTGGCYTHKGLMGMGMKTMLRRLHSMYMSGKILPYNSDTFDGYVKMSKQYHPVLTRFGGYGEPVTLPLNMISSLYSLSAKSTGYTHQWHKPDVKEYKIYLMASTHNPIETSIANDIGWRVFFAKNKGDKYKGAVCPAAKEFTGNKKTCIECGACNGTASGNSKNILINKH